MRNILFYALLTLSLSILMTVSTRAKTDGSYYMNSKSALVFTGIASLSAKHNSLEVKGFNYKAFINASADMIERCEHLALEVMRRPQAFSFAIIASSSFIHNATYHTLTVTPADDVDCQIVSAIEASEGMFAPEIGATVIDRRK